MCYKMDRDTTRLIENCSTWNIIEFLFLANYYKGSIDAFDTAYGNKGNKNYHRLELIQGLADLFHQYGLIMRTTYEALSPQSDDDEKEINNKLKHLCSLGDEIGEYLKKERLNGGDH